MTLVDRAIAAVALLAGFLITGAYYFLGEKAVIVAVIVSPLALTAVIVLIGFELMRFAEKEYSHVKEPPVEKSKFPLSKLEAGLVNSGQRPLTYEDIFGQEKSEDEADRDISEGTKQN